MGLGLLVSSRFHDHTHFRHTTVGRTPLDEGPARRRDLYLTTLTSDRHPAPGGIRTHDPSKRAAEDPRLRPHGHWDRPVHGSVLHLTILIKSSSSCVGRWQTPTQPNNILLALNTWTWSLYVYDYLWQLLHLVDWSATVARSISNNFWWIRPIFLHSMAIS
jgi:hypothetical protein